MPASGYEFFHDIAQILLEEFQSEVGFIVRALLRHYRAGSMVRVYDDIAVLYACVLDDLFYLFGNIVKGRV
jgi:hypothetical protein